LKEGLNFERERDGRSEDGKKGKRCDVVMRRKRKRSG
jgi:hypothetical protein